ncbi:hypothetical protein Pmani_014209 [Petrolisthes manimaculis]|uniref:Uncharacterized protein n=1 Tax=Petrolisthes manimaculis TaxID=1843537 RepID=A0AAE1PW33_9EUCA|nr:hypothetical protein Pmani_014209 [Petrolisthes manimaculis]
MSDNDGQVDDPGVQRDRKRCRDPAKWKQNIAKRQRNRREEYTCYTHCKTGFVSILGISEARVKTAMLSMSSTGNPRGDLRGHHPPGVMPPMTDICTRCDTFKVAIEKANPEAKAELRENNEKHLDLARRGQRLMKRLIFREGYQLAMDYDGPMGSVRLEKGNAGYRLSLFNLLKVTLPLKYLTVRSIDPCKIKHLEDFLDIMTVSQGQYLQYIIEQQRKLTRNDSVEDD